MPERIQLRRAKGWRMPPNTVKVDRTGRGMQALMQVELDQVPPAGVLQALRHLPQVDEVRFIPALGNGA